MRLAWGLPTSTGIDLFTSVFTAFNQRYPGITFALTEAIVARQNELLLSGQLDLGLVMLLESARINLEYITLFEEDLILGIPKNHRKPRGPIPLACHWPSQISDGSMTVNFL